MTATSRGAVGAGGAQRRSSSTLLLATPLPLRGLMVVAVVAGFALPLLAEARGLGVREPKNPISPTLLALLLVSVVNVEIGRLLEGRGLIVGHRPHKALSAWSFCCALLLPPSYLLLVVPFCYVHARWRGMHIELWKWVGSAAYLVLCGVAAGVVAHLVSGDPNLMDDDGGWGLLAVLAAAVAFLAVETVLFHASAYLNRPEDETWLRETLRSRSFYATEASVLLMGGLSAAVWTAGAWFLVLLVPVYALAQRAALHDSVRQRADMDDKTGLLRFESWRVLAVAEQARCEAKDRAWSLAFADLDNFKAFNDTYGHLAGDTALAAVAEVLRDELRSRDLVGRFGGEEFCVFLPDTSPEEAAIVAERLRVSVLETPLPTDVGPTSVSIGVVSFVPDLPQPVEFVAALAAADRALFEAKTAGRNRVVAHTYSLVHPPPPLRSEPRPAPGS